METLASTKCIVCSVEVIQDPLKPVLGANISHLSALVCSDKCESQKREELQREDNEKLFKKILRILPRKYIGVKSTDFDKMELRHVLSWDENQARADGFAVLQYFCNDPQWCLVLSSEVSGNKKTRLALYALACLALKGLYRMRDPQQIQDAGYYSAISICSMVRNEAFNHHQPNTKSFHNSRVLVIDDMGQEEVRDSIQLAGILKHREENNLKTIITTNLNPQEIRERYTERINSRLAYGVYRVIGTDCRKRGFK